MQFWEFMFVPTILFMVIVMPIWLVMHYKYKSKNSSTLGENDQLALDDALRALDNIAERLEVLESILDEHNPKWKQDSKRS